MQRYQKLKKSKINFMLVMLVTIILGASSGLFYMDTVYGDGKIKAWFLSYAKKTPSSIQTTAQTTEQTTEQTTAQTEQPAEGEQNANANKDAVNDTEQKEPMAEEVPIVAKDSIPIESEGATYFTLFGKKILMCTKDGVQFLNSIGDQKWSDTFTMSVPYMIREGNFVAVGDMSGRTITVYNDVGKQYSVQAEGPLVWFALNKSGYLSVISNNTTHYAVMVYDQKGRKIIGRIEESPGVYPLSVDVSDDNTVFAVSYLDITDVVQESKILFFYVGEVDQSEHTDSMFATAREPDQIIPIISFMKNNICVAISDQKIDGFNKEGKKQWEISLTNRIEEIDFGNPNYIVLSMGESLSGKDGLKTGTVLWINADGKTTASFEAGGNVTYLKSFEDLVVVGSHNYFYGVKNNGNLVWELPAKGEVSDILMMESSTKALYVTTQSAQIVDMLQKSGFQKSPSVSNTKESETKKNETKQKEEQSAPEPTTTPTQTEPKQAEPTTPETTDPAPQETQPIENN